MIEYLPHIVMFATILYRFGSFIRGFFELTGPVDEKTKTCVWVWLVLVCAVFAMAV